MPSTGFTFDCEWNYKFCVWERLVIVDFVGVSHENVSIQMVKKELWHSFSLEWNERYFNGLYKLAYSCLYYSQAFHYFECFSLNSVTSYTCIFPLSSQCLINQFLHGSSPFRLKHFVTSLLRMCCIYDMVHCEHNQTTNKSQAQGSRNQ